MFSGEGYFKSISSAKESSPEAESPVRFVACGDMGPVRNLESIASKGGAAHILGEMAPVLNKADFVFANVEATYSTRGAPLDRIPVFRLHPAAFDLVRQANVTVASLANNHMFDYGLEAFCDTVELLNNHDIKYCGAGLTLEDALRPVIFEMKGVRFGFIAFRDKESKFLIDNGVITSQMFRETINIAIDSLKEQVDWVIVSLHFGLEYKFTPRPADVRMCRDLIDRGADIILGHHPHYPQGIESYNGGVIVYSLGNFIWDQNFVGNTSASYVLEILLTKNHLESVKIIPFHMTKEYQLKLDINDEAFAHISKLSTVLTDQKCLDAKWYFITRDFFQLFCKELWQRLWTDRQSPSSLYTWWVKQLGPRYKNTLNDFFKYVIQGKAFYYEARRVIKKRRGLQNAQKDSL